MTAPTFKVLLHSISLGAPPEPVGGVRALVEQVLLQQQEIDELRRQVALLSNRLASLTRLAEPEHGPPSSRNAQLGPSEPLHGPASQHPPSQQSQHVPPSQRPPSAEPSPAGASATQSGSSPARHPSNAPPPITPPRPIAPEIVGHEFEEEEGEERFGTLVISRKEVLSAKEAPFPITPPTTGKPRPAGEIPGAPWARQQAQPAPRAVSEDTYASDGTDPEHDPLNQTAEVRAEHLHHLQIPDEDSTDGEGPPPIPDIDDEEGAPSGRGLGRSRS